MLLFHSTPGSNSLSIYSLGITIESAKAEPRRIWLHTWRKRRWARLHLAVRYKIDPREITTFAVELPRAWVKKFSRGLWTCERSIHSGRLLGQTFHLHVGAVGIETRLGYDFDIFSPPGEVPSVS